MMFGYIGQIGSGKTLSMIRDVVRRYEREKGRFQIYSNIHLKGLKYTFLKLEDLMLWAQEEHDFKGETLMIVDEFHIWMDSRSSMMRKSRIVSYFLLQTRKVGVDLYWTTQFPDQVDKRVRNLSDISIECYHKPRSQWFHNIIIRRLLRGYSTTVRHFKGEPYFKFYDTREVVKLPRVSKKDEDMLEGV
jgi:hypothetical protein